MLPPHITRAGDLVTSREATTRGFIDQAQQKVRLASGYIQQARDLDDILATGRELRDLLADEDMRHTFLTAIGFSEKAISHLSKSQQEAVLDGSLAELEAVAAVSLRQEIVYRFLLTSGDSVGGVIRNLAGAQGKDIFSNAVLAALKNGGHKFTVDQPEGALRPRSISWENRLLVFDRQTKAIMKNNIDAILLDTGGAAPNASSLLGQRTAYIACGEIKGGVDPAGADEHWKTAHAALERIRTSFGLMRPALFFAAVAIESAMAGEIVSQLRDNRLTYAANLTNADQVADLANWLAGL